MLKKLFRISIVLFVLLVLFGFISLYRQTAREILNPVAPPAAGTEYIEITIRHADGTRDRYQVPPSPIFQFTKTGTEANLLVSNLQVQVSADDVVCTSTSAVPQIFRAIGDVEGNQTCLTVADAQ